MPFKTASQYVRDRLGIGFEVIDVRLDNALGEIKRGVGDVCALITRLENSTSFTECDQIQKELVKNPFFSECDPNFSFVNDPHIARFRYWQEQPKVFEKLKFKVCVLDAWWAANSPPPKATPAQNKATPAPLVAEKPWLVVDPKDPSPVQPWYTPARYFARQHVLSDSTLLNRKPVLAEKVSQSLSDVGIYKRGGSKPFDESTVLKAFSNVTLGKKLSNFGRKV